MLNICYAPSFGQILIFRLEIWGWKERLRAIHVEQRDVEANLEDLDALRVTRVLAGDEPDTLRIEPSVYHISGVQRIERGQNLRQVVLRKSCN